MIRDKNILVISAHFDDEVLGCGGTISKLSKFNNISVLIVTDSCSTQYKDNYDEMIKKKQNQSFEVSEILGVDNYLFGNLPDMKLDSLDSVVINDLIKKSIDDTKADIVFTHHGSDVNKDHKLIFESTMVATRPINGDVYVEEVYCYEVLSSSEWSFSKFDGFIPNIWIDIKKQIDIKKSAMKIYDTESKDYPHPRSAKGIQILAQKRGLEVGLKYAECFLLVRKTMF